MKQSVLEDSLEWCVSETAGYVRQRESVALFGVVRRETEKNSSLNCTSTLHEHFQTLARSPCGNDKWITSCVPVSVGAHDTVVLRSEELNGPIDLNRMNLGSILSVIIAVTDQQGTRHVAYPDLTGLHYTDSDSMMHCSSRFVLPIVFETSENLKRINTQLIVLFAGQRITFELLIHNSGRAYHPGGFWDLGDKGSCFLQSIELMVSPVESQNICGRPELWDIERRSREPSAVVNEGDRLLQHCSGAEGADGRVHMMCGGALPLLVENARLSDESCSDAMRASPLIRLRLKGYFVTVHIPRFWQEFPKAIKFENENLVLELLADIDESAHELQGGERKRFAVELLMSNYDGCGHSNEVLLAKDSELALRHPLRILPSVSEEALARLVGRALTPTHPFDVAILGLIVDPSEFLDKRERIDEYGWRHFGEVWADHECRYQSADEPPFVSHYNNQYDLILGFGLAWLRSGDVRWADLMNDLARHVVDIDLYTTDDDRPEYCHGLFWHTNHYATAQTSTHRTWSLKNADTCDPSSLGGGPGSEHCYTTGLLLHYLITGDELSKNAVISLATWVSRLADGDSSGGAAITRSIRKIPALFRGITGDSAGQRNYPMSRGTGNRVIAGLDAHYLTGDRQWLLGIERVIRGTFHSSDNIEARQLDRVEKSWSYVVFLEAVLRYLQRKESLTEIDDNYVGARAAFVHYCVWMARNDGPWLERAEQLTFVNDTWAAQDARKPGLLLAAATRSTKFTLELEVAANRLATHVQSQLESSDERTFARVQALLLWSLGASTLHARENPPCPDKSVKAASSCGIVCLFSDMILTPCRAISRIQFRKEWYWLRAQFERR